MQFLTTTLESVTIFADSFAAYSQGLGPFGIVLFILVYIAVILCFLPITPFSLTAGVIYGWWGIPIAYIGSICGSMIAFLIARGVGHKHVRRLCEKKPIVRALERTLVKGGFRLVLLIRLSGVLPFAVQNYSFGVTAVDWRSYLSASLLGLMPGAVVKVWIGKTGMDALHGEFWANRLGSVSFIAAVVLTAALLIYVGTLAVRELRAAGVLQTAKEQDLGAPN